MRIFLFTLLFIWAIAGIYTVHLFLEEIKPYPTSRGRLAFNVIICFFGWIFFQGWQLTKRLATILQGFLSSNNTRPPA